MHRTRPRTRRAGASRRDDECGVSPVPGSGCLLYSGLGWSSGVVPARAGTRTRARAAGTTVVYCRILSRLGVSIGNAFFGFQRTRSLDEVKGKNAPMCWCLVRGPAASSSLVVRPVVPTTSIPSPSKEQQQQQQQPRGHRCSPGRRARTTTRATLLSCPQTLTLFSVPGTADADLVSEVVDSAWSLQYMVRGPVCGSAGSIETSLLPSPAAQDRERLLAAFNNAVLFRYANRETLEGFLSHAKTKLMLDEMSSDEGKSTHGIASLAFSVEVPNELEAIFRRGDEWENGVELFMGLDDRTADGGSAEEDVLEFFTLVNQLATSSAFGALQSGIGRVDALIFHSLHDETATETRAAVVDLLQCRFVYAVRFADQSQLEALLQSPPMQAILNGDDRSPVRLHWGIVQRIVSPEENDKVGKASV